MIEDHLRYLFSERKEMRSENDWTEIRYSLFISAFNASDRVRAVYDSVSAERKLWVGLAEYDYGVTELPEKEDAILCSDVDESVCAREIQHHIGDRRLLNGPVCIDITGFMRHHVIFLVKYLKHLGVDRFYALYAEPIKYGQREDTVFSVSDVVTVRQVAGFEGGHNYSGSIKDCLVLGVGYDHNPTARTILAKDRAKLVKIHSLPSLSADMYQESMLRFHRVGVPPGGSDSDLYACANDPFVVASMLSQYVKPKLTSGEISNLYLAPLATKPQALGFALFYVRELEGMPASILLPFTHHYSRQTSEGVGCIWRYEIVLG